MRATSEAILPILLCWLRTSEANIGGMEVKVELSYQYSIKFCCPATDGSRKAVWHRTAYEPNVCNWISPCWKNGYHWHSSALAEHSWGPNKWTWAQCGGGWWVSAQVTATVGCCSDWCGFVWELHAGSCSSLAKIHIGGGKYAERYCFVAKSFLYPIAWFCSLYLL